MNICIVFTGGTIGSVSNDGIIGLNEDSQYRLLELYNTKYAEEIEVETVSPIWTLSENIGFCEISIICYEVKKLLETKKYDGIIVTHGTDSLQYTAAALGVALDGVADIPVIFVSSNKVLDADGSNGLENFHAAVKFIEYRTAGVYVSYKNEGDNPKIFAPETLLPSVPSSDLLLSIGTYVAELKNGEIFRNIRFVKRNSQIKLPDEPIGFSSDVLYVKNYVGMGTMLERLDLSGIKHIVFEGYHSCTLPTQNHDFAAFCRRASSRGIKLYTTTVSGDRYESTEGFEELSIINVPDISPIALYIRIAILSFYGMPITFR